MDQGSYRKHNMQEDLSSQGRYGENTVSVALTSWICPNCETVNIEGTCFVCGYQKGKCHRKYHPRRILFATMATVVLVGMSVFAAGTIKFEKNTELAVKNEPTIATESVAATKSKSETIKESKYRQARVYWDHHVYDTAHNLLSELSGYMDADTLLSELEVEWATYALEQEEWPQSMTSFATKVSLDERESALIYKAILRAPVAPPVWLPGMLKGDLSDLDTVKVLCSILSVATEPLKNLQGNRKIIEEYWEYPMVQDYIETNFKELLWGSWKSEDGEYINFEYERYGCPDSSLPEPELPPEQRAYCTLGKAYSLGADTENMIIIFSYELLNLDTMEVRCSENGETYTMYRQK